MTGSNGRCGASTTGNAHYRAAHGRYAHDLTLLNVGDIHVEGLDFRPTVQVTESRYELRAAGFDGAVVHLREDGRVTIASP